MFGKTLQPQTIASANLSVAMSKVTEREGCTAALAFVEDQLRHDLAKKI